MKFTLNIDSDNAAMQTYEDLADAVRQCAQKVGDYQDDGIVRDDNGNTIGRFTVELPEPDPLQGRDPDELHDRNR